MKSAFDRLRKFLVDPLVGWPNADLMVEERTRHKLRDGFAPYVEILDWPSLRDLFLEHDIRANRYRQRVRTQGKLAIAMATAGLIFAALSSLITDAQEIWRYTFGIFACLLTFLGGALGFEHLVLGYSKRRWLYERAWTERLRQFYFQTIHHHLPLILSALSGDQTAKAEWKQIQDSEIAWFVKNWPADPESVFTALKDDILDGEAWLRGPPNEIDPSVLGDPAVGGLTEFVGRQRLGVQTSYTGRKLDRTIHGPSTRAGIFRTVANGLTGLVLLVALTMGFLILGDYPLSEPPLLWLAAAQGAGCALVAGLRIADEGLRFSDEADLYSWYSAAVLKMSHGYETAENYDRLLRLRELEQASYVEFRRFILMHKEANFLL